MNYVEKNLMNGYVSMNEDFNHSTKNGMEVDSEMKDSNLMRDQISFKSSLFGNKSKKII